MAGEWQGQGCEGELVRGRERRDRGAREENSSEAGNGGKEDGEIWKMESAFSMPGGAPCPAGARRDAKKVPPPRIPRPGSQVPVLKLPC